MAESYKQCEEAKMRYLSELGVARRGLEKQEQRIEQLEADAGKVCVWKYEADYDLPHWSTSCGDAVCFGEGGPDELTRGNVNFCWMCGGKVTATTEGEAG